MVVGAYRYGATTLPVVASVSPFAPPAHVNAPVVVAPRVAVAVAAAMLVVTFTLLISPQGACTLLGVSWPVMAPALWRRTRATIATKRSLWRGERRSDMGT